MSVRIIADSSSDAELIEDDRLTVLPLTVTIEGTSYLDRVNLSSEEFYEAISKIDSVPQTSQVNPYDYEQEFNKAHSRGEQVVCICLSSTVSGTYNSACIAAQSTNAEVYVVDSRQIAMGTNIQVRYALQLADEGLSAKEIAEKLEETKGSIKLLAVIDTLEFLRRSGRAPKIVAYLGDHFNIKPLFTLDDGQPKLLSKSPGWKSAYRNFTKQIFTLSSIDYDKPVCFAYSGLTDENLRTFLDETHESWSEHLSEEELNITLAGSTIGTHVGPGAIGVAFYTK